MQRVVFGVGVEGWGAEVRTRVMVVVRSCPGHPRLSEEELVTVAFKVSRSRREELDRRAEARGETRSQFLRGILERELAS